MKLVPRLIIGGIPAIIIFLIFVFYNMAGIGFLVALLVFVYIIYNLTDEASARRKQVRKRNRERRDEERDWRREEYHKEKGRQIARSEAEAREREEKRARKEFKEHGFMGKPVWHDAMFGGK